MSQTCLNCGSLVKSKYCPECGQKSDIGRINMHALIHEFWHGFTHTDKGVLRLWLDLLLRPRRTYDNYFSGHRKHYFSPVVFFLVSFGIYIFLDQKVFDYEDHLVMLRTGHPFNDEWGRFTYEHAKMVALMLLPVQALLSWALFFRRRNLAECIVFWLFCTGFVNTVLALLTPLRLLLIDDRETVDFWLNLLAILIILVHALAVFGNNWFSYVKTAVLIFFLSVLSNYTDNYLLYRHIAADSKVPGLLEETKKSLYAPTFWESVEEVYTKSGGYEPFGH
jgi:hypothetical protein